MKHILLIIGFVLFALSSIAQDENGKYYSVKLNNGKEIKGTITEYVPENYLVIYTDDGDVLRYNTNEVKMIKRTHRQDKIAFMGGFIDQGPQHGYRGFIDGGMCFATDRHIFSISTTHGYQFVPWLFVGVGYQFQRFRVYDGYNVGNHIIYGDLRMDFLKSNITPFVGFRAGYNTGKHMGAMVSPMAGVRFGFNKSPLALNLSLGYVYQQWNRPKYVTDFEANLIIEDETEITKRNVGGFTIRLGLEF